MGGVSLWGILAEIMGVGAHWGVGLNMGGGG